MLFLVSLLCAIAGLVALAYLIRATDPGDEVDVELGGDFRPLPLVYDHELGGYPRRAV